MSATSAATDVITLELTTAEARSLRARLLQPSADGSTALDDRGCEMALSKLSHQLEYVDSLAQIRTSLAECGLDGAGLADDQVAELGRQIAKATAAPRG
ncbi:MAG: hypothetical protein QOK31_1699 [Solirubrobacteraceae bacterium]|jgi:hypothetical protein|nr:hypothetical protein [Solirubrobacteraceae bacterium]